MTFNRYVVEVGHRQPEPVRNYRFATNRQAKNFIEALIKPKSSEMAAFITSGKTLTSKNGEVMVLSLKHDLDSL